MHVGLVTLALAAAQVATAQPPSGPAQAPTTQGVWNSAASQPGRSSTPASSTPASSTLVDADQTQNQNPTPVPVPPQTPGPGPAPELGFYTAGQLAERCSPGDNSNPGLCFAYITGVHDSVRAYELWLTMTEFCVPRQTPQVDLRQAFLDYLQAHPQDASAQAASVVVISLKERFRCDPPPPAPAPEPPPAPTPETRRPPRR